MQHRRLANIGIIIVIIIIIVITSVISDAAIDDTLVYPTCRRHMSADHRVRTAAAIAVVALHRHMHVCIPTADAIADAAAVAVAVGARNVAVHIAVGFVLRHQRLLRLRHILHVPDLLQEARQLAAFQLQREAHLRILIAQRAQLGENRQQFGKQNHALGVAAMAIQNVHAQRVDVVALDGLHQIRLLQTGSIREYDDGRQQCVLHIVNGQRVHLAAKMEQILDGVGHAGHDVRIARVRAIVGEQDRIGGGIVATRHAQHHHFAGARLCGFRGRVRMTHNVCE